MGLNTIFPYVFWNMLEPVQGTWNNTGVNDIATFFRIAQEEDLHVVLRPGPYICGEREWGGFPAWLANVPGMVVRSNNAPFLEAATAYIENLAKDLRPLQVEKGGPILLVQVENEYGSFADDHAYTSALRDILRANFEDPVLYTNDGGVDWTLEGGSVPGILAAIDGDPWSGFSSIRKYITDPTQKGPSLDGEYYTWAPDIWGSTNEHADTQGHPEVVQQFVKDLDYVLGNESASISLYMVHGGSNFGFSNGALWQNRTKVFTSSYDYGAPIDESGRTNDLYNTFRETIQKYVPNGSIPEVLPNLPLLAVAEFDLTPMARFFEYGDLKTTDRFPRTMEGLGQDYGFALYEHVSTSTSHGILRPGDRARDRVIVYVNGSRFGVIDSQYQYPVNLTVSLQPGDKLQLLVENLGRVDYYSRGTPYQNYLQDPYKGIVGNVTVGGSAIQSWNMFTFPLGEMPQLRNVSITNDSTPLFYRGAFTINKTSTTDSLKLDTFLAIPAGIKGNVWVNGFHLGRYWRVGPQQSLYCPGTLLKAGGADNEVIVLELEPDRVKGPMIAYGQSERTWGNNADDDCPGCS
ncbi:glycoside hydrolase family 35 protein [Lophiostoma macrostomum CBS 122681]|uniref:Glycoside hydrolase family 35 protein n=1 Tax=Lophiostoma macrostomum CBS 122681 TaxID=1314788 RepID=A0A6A6SVK4_9PLEO|nr:glycoside hydrolase family 35 protein [Lophiostoma macrostomum CBS 122681]